MLQQHPSLNNALVETSCILVINKTELGFLASHGDCRKTAFLEVSYMNV